MRAKGKPGKDIRRFGARLTTKAEKQTWTFQELGMQIVVWGTFRVGIAFPIRFRGKNRPRIPVR